MNQHSLNAIIDVPANDIKFLRGYIGGGIWKTDGRGTHGEILSMGFSY